LFARRDVELGEAHTREERLFRVITGVVTSFVGWAALVSVPANAVAQQNQPLIIKGPLT
jgi:hypothetical protein